MATPQPVAEAGLSLEYRDEGTTLIVRDARPDSSRIRNRGGEALAQLLMANRQIKKLDLSESGISDNGIGFICIALRQTDQLESLSLSPVGVAGLEFLMGVVRRCTRLVELSASFVDMETLVTAAQNVTLQDYDVSAYAGKPKGDGDDEEEEEEADAGAAAEDEGDDDEDPEARERRKIERLRKLLNEDDYDSGDEGPGGAKQPPAAEAATVGPSSSLSQLLGAFVEAVREKPNLTSVACAGEAVPADVLRELARAVEEHCEQKERRARDREARCARTAYDALRDQLAELTSASGASGEFEQMLLPGEDSAPEGHTHMGIRAFVGRRLFAALGEAAFECQRFKSKENEAVADWQGECAFLAMYVRKLAASEAGRR